LFPKYLKTIFFLFSLLIFGLDADAATYYLTNANQTTAQSASSWNTNPAGGGTTAGNFTTNGDIFIIPVGISGIWGANSTLGSSSPGNEITLQVLGTLTINSGVVISLAGKNSNQSSV
jgi:hypothetical protein